MGKKSKDAAMEASAERNWIPGWIGGVTSPAAQKSAGIWERDTLKARIIAFEKCRRGDIPPEDIAPIFPR